MNTRIIRGFSLIEVLIGVLILALGLLGLGAIIPVVIREQRIAVMQTLGNECASSAKKYLISRPDLDPAVPFDLDQSVMPWRAQPTIGWDQWLLDATWSREAPPPPGVPTADAHLWMPRRTSGPRPEFVPSSIGPFQTWLTDTGHAGDFGWHLARTGQPDPDRYVVITLADRLWPNESVQGEASLRQGLDPHRPQFVWDFIGRRVQTSLGEPRELQIAIFVRQIDLNIRIPRWTYTIGAAASSGSLRDVLLNTHNRPNGAEAVPVCSYSPTAGAQAYLPTNTGVLASGGDLYSEPISLGDPASGITLDFDPADSASWLEFTGFPAGDNRWSLVRQTGQKLVDNLGNVYTVRGTLEDLEPGTYQQQFPNRYVLVIDPPIPAYIPYPGSPGYNANAVGRLRQVVFTPQVPVAVEVFTITRAVP